MLSRRQSQPVGPVATAGPQRTRQYSYWLIDVFAEHPFSGAPLAVFTDARGLEARFMLALARELNRTRTVFLFPQADPKRNPKVRVFSPQGEIATANYPTIAAAFTVAVEQGHLLATSFHPELTGDSRMHAHFLRRINRA